MDGPINVENGCGALFVSRLRTVSVVALGAFVAICSAQEYRVIDLGPMRPERRMAFVGGTGFENLVIAGHSDVNGVESPLLFSPQNNQVRWLSTLPQTRFALAYGVNSSGDAIGMNANLENGHADGHAIFQDSHSSQSRRPMN